MPIHVKICGITTLADARYCAGAGADLLGFIFHRQSKRVVQPEDVRQIAEWIHGPEIVGVFVDEPVETVSAVAERAGLTMVQLHGSESPEECRIVSRPVIKAFRVRPWDSARTLTDRMRPYEGAVRYFLLDTYSPASAGGTGETFDWTIAAELAADFPLLLSGGITAENVRGAVETVRPLGVDLSSGVESAPGVKDFDLLADFFETFDAVRTLEPSISDR